MARLVLIFLLLVSGLATAAEPALQCRIHFVDDPPYQKRWLPWQEDHYRIAFEIVNKSDSTFRILRPGQCSGCGYQVVAVSYWGLMCWYPLDSTYISDARSYMALSPGDTIAATIDAADSIRDFFFWGGQYEVHLEFFVLESADHLDDPELTGPPWGDTLKSNELVFKLTAPTASLIEHYWTADERDSEDLATLMYYRVFEEPNEFYRMMAKNGSAYHRFLYTSLPLVFTNKEDTAIAHLNRRRKWDLEDLARITPQIDSRYRTLHEKLIYVLNGITPRYESTTNRLRWHLMDYLRTEWRIRHGVPDSAIAPYILRIAIENLDFVYNYMKSDTSGYTEWLDALPDAVFTAYTDSQLVELTKLRDSAITSLENTQKETRYPIMHRRLIDKLKTIQVRLEKSDEK